MNLYQVFTNCTDYMTPHFNIDEVEDKRGDDDFIIDIRPKRYADEWEPLEIEFCLEDGLPNIPTLSKWQNYLVLHESAYKALEGVLGPYGEFLPCTHQNAKFYLFNPLIIAEDLDAVVPDSVTLNGNLLTGIEFDKDKLKDVPVFRSKESYITIYCTDAFKDVVEAEKLDGLLFSTNLTHY
ncbi:hypothetical protein MO867_20270 [Microbulbifer sp. OS29]|uniref:Uncharacterized protein n=1 Tax=Microbulbifer okhotskensis TaxID=2926617 RepID=A0A9X2ESJ6_9GAMM|nr:hypothetical protein [Microbulbifer okhotskensis]MCO1336665.1 hypothetical protein [Microbulbifer okhotskensis]